MNWCFPVISSLFRKKDAGPPSMQGQNINPRDKTNLFETKDFKDLDELLAYVDGELHRAVSDEWKVEKLKWGMMWVIRKKWLSQGQNTWFEYHVIISGDLKELSIVRDYDWTVGMIGKDDVLMRLNKIRRDNGLVDTIRACMSVNSIEE